MGLDNDAFRKFLEEKKPAPQKKQKQVKKKSASTGKPGKKHGAAAEEDEGPKYRDRADERRRGITVEESAPSFLTAEETRYLGGSMDRTHLVRGLDRLLLNQVRGVNANQEAEEVEEIEAQPVQDAQPALPTHFKSAVGRAVANCLLKPPASSVAELFQPKRMAFVYFGNDAAADSDEEEGEAIEWGGDTGVASIPETLLRSKADCPVPPDAMNAAADAAVLTEVAGVMKAVKVESRHRGKDRRRDNTEADAATAAAQKEKEQHILKLKMYENPKLVAELASRKPAAAATRPAAAATEAAKDPAPGARGQNGAAATAADADSDSGIFDDVGDDYQVDVSSIKSKAAGAKPAAGKLFDGPSSTSDLPPTAQHGHADGNEGARGAPPQPGAAWPAQPGTAYPPPHAPNAYSHAHHGYGGLPPPGPYGQQGPPYGHQGYYDSFGNWVPYTAADYAQWGYSGAAAGAGAYVAAAAPPPGAKDDQSASGRGKGFAAKMGDRAQVKSSFTLEQRKARIGKGFVEGEGDEYGAEILVGGGGLEDEEEDLRDMESRARTLNRADFETDEQFQAYKSQREAAPKAAFQFGVKMADGRRTHKDMEKRNNNKIDNELKQLRNMKGEKAGRNVDFTQFDGAFGSAQKDGVAPTPARKRPKLQGI